MASIVQTVWASGITTASSFNTAFISTPTSGNLVVLVYGARDDDNSQCPSFTVSAPAAGSWSSPSDGVLNLDDLRSSMEFHTFSARWLVSGGSSIGTITVTPNENVNSWWIGLIEITETSVTNWSLEAVEFAGTGASNATTIASGSTGMLTSNAEMAIGIGTSRTNTEGLSHDSGFTSLSDLDAVAQIDAGSANFICSRKNLTTTDAIDLTTTQSPGASRMASAVLVFSQTGGAAATSHPGRLRSSQIAHLLRR